MSLPPVIRPYWSQLQAEKAAAPEHRAWEYAADPFAARKEVDDRQARRKEKEKETVKDSDSSRPGSGTVTPMGGRGVEWARAPEVKMSGSLREMVEGTVKKVRLGRVTTDDR